MAHHTGISRQNTVITHGCAASKTGIRRQCTVVANDHVVGNLHVIVNNHTIADAGIPEGTAINCRAGANFNIVANLDTANLVNLLPLSAAPSGAKPKPSAPITEPL